jgi:hypothetical protein
LFNPSMKHLQLFLHVSHESGILLLLIL